MVLRSKQAAVGGADKDQDKNKLFNCKRTVTTQLDSLEFVMVGAALVQMHPS